MVGLAGKAVHFDERYLQVDLEDGRRISTPLHWYPPLEQTSVKTLRDYHLNIAAMLEFPLSRVA
ncbi:DUF2442 domain-containing protein [Thiorhodospira sibirica]|uniref:DUF2442 domain-containing protein n=1 Tax=Thiorhodospira sibirica TaxID=154347 RepID=UPI00022C4C2D